MKRNVALIALLVCLPIRTAVRRSDSYGRRCLMARRLVERGVRFVQLYIDGQIWDNHSRLEKTLKSACDRTDQPVATDGYWVDLNTAIQPQ